MKGDGPLRESIATADAHRTSDGYIDDGSIRELMDFREMAVLMDDKMPGVLVDGWLMVEAR